MVQIAAGKPYLFKCVLASKGCVELTQLWHSIEVFTDLAQSVADSVAPIDQLAGHKVEKAF